MSTLETFCLISFRKVRIQSHKTIPHHQVISFSLSVPIFLPVSLLLSCYPSVIQFFFCLPPSVPLLSLSFSHRLDVALLTQHFIKAMLKKHCFTHSLLQPCLCVCVCVCISAQCGKPGWFCTYWDGQDWKRVPRGPLHMPVPFRLGPGCICPGMCSNFRLAGKTRQVWREVEHVMLL